MAEHTGLGAGRGDVQATTFQGLEDHVVGVWREVEGLRREEGGKKGGKTRRVRRRGWEGVAWFKQQENLLSTILLAVRWRRNHGGNGGPREVLQLKIRVCPHIGACMQTVSFREIWKPQ